MDRGGSFLEVRFSIPDLTYWSTDVAQRWGVQVRLLYCRPLPGTPYRIHRLFEITGAPAESTAFVRYLHQRAQPDVLAPSPLAAGRWLVSVRERTDARCTAAHRSGAFCLTCPLAVTARPGGSAQWSVLIPRPPRRGNPVARLRDAAAHAGAHSELRGVRGYTGTRLLTSRQEHALETAAELGYFEVPRRSSLSDVASALGVRRSTALEHIRKGLERIIMRRSLSSG